MEQEVLKDAVLLVTARTSRRRRRASVLDRSPSRALGDLPDSRVWYLAAAPPGAADGAARHRPLHALGGRAGKRVRTTSPSIRLTYGRIARRVAALAAHNARAMAAA